MLQIFLAKLRVALEHFVQNDDMGIHVECRIYQRNVVLKYHSKSMIVNKMEKTVLLQVGFCKCTQGRECTPEKLTPGHKISWDNIERVKLIVFKDIGIIPLGTGRQKDVLKTSLRRQVTSERRFNTSF